MNRAKQMLVCFGAVAIATASVTLAFVQARAARNATEELRMAKERREMLRAQIAKWEGKVRGEEKRALAAERDTAELLSAVKSLRAQPVPLDLRTRSTATRGSETADGDAIDGTAVRAQHVTAARTDGAIAEVQSRAAGGAVLSAEEQARLAQERAYQQALAKKRVEEAKDRAAFDSSTYQLDPATRFNLLLQRAREQAARADFGAAVRTFNEAMTIKPADVPVSPEALELQAVLQTQNKPVDVTLISDGETFVSVTNARRPAKFINAVVSLLPGDYEIVGRRRGYRDVRTRLQVRADAPVPAVSVICTQAAGQ
jgi:hypothetical protein